MSTPRLARPASSSTIRTALGAIALSVVTLPVLGVGAGTAADTGSDPEYRKVTAPNVFYPLRGSQLIEDQVNYSETHRGTDMGAPCGTAVFSSQPGTALVRSDPAWGGRSVVRVVSNTGGLVTGYAYLARSYVTTGQIIAPGQAIGTVGPNVASGQCGLYYTVYQSGVVQNPTTWLRYHVGYAPPTPQLFGGPGINLASFNFLGASHTPAGGRMPTYAPRMARAVPMIRYNKLDVIGAQELQKPQVAYFDRLTAGQWGNYHARVRWDDTDNSLLWNKSTMEFVQGTSFAIPYFGGNLRYMPAVLLRQKATGRTAWFMNVHNPADVRGNAAVYRARAVAIERAKMIALRATGRPVFLTGDFNDRERAYCPLTSGKLAMSPNSIPSVSCNYPSPSSIDWIFAAGQTRFSYFNRNPYPQRARISDHPIVLTRAHLQD